MNVSDSAIKPSQLKVLISDKWLLASLTLIPLLLAFSIWWIFSQGIARDLSFGVVDLDHSSLSRNLIREFDATSSLQVSRQFSSVAQAKQALINDEIYAYAVIPNNFAKHIYISNRPSVSVFYNSQYILVGKLIASAVQQAQGTFNAQVGAVKQLAKGNATINSALGKAVAIQTQITALFNKNSNYAQFLVSALIPAIWQIVIIVATILALDANYRMYGLQTMLTDKPFRQLAKTLGFYLPIFMLLGFGFLSWFYIGLKWPFEGSFAALIYAQLLTVLSCMVMGALFYFLTLDPARAMSFAGAFTAPGFAFMGITFPASDMNSIALFWRSLLPISHYIEAQVAQVSYGVAWFETVFNISVSMAGYLLPTLLLVVLVKKQIRKDIQSRKQDACLDEALL